MWIEKLVADVGNGLRISWWKQACGRDKMITLADEFVWVTLFQRLPVRFTVIATSTFNWLVEDLSFHCASQNLSGLTINNCTFPIAFKNILKVVQWLFPDLHSLVWNETLKPFDFTVLLNGTQAKCMTNARKRFMKTSCINMYEPFSGKKKRLCNISV